MSLCVSVCVCVYICFLSSFARLEVVDRELAFMDRDAQKKLEAFEKARTVRIFKRRACVVPMVAIIVATVLA